MDIRRVAFALLAAMTVLTFGGPLAIFVVLKGGRSPHWPPDRPVEGWVFWGVTGAVAFLFVACLVAAWKVPRRPSGSGQAN